jgi:hypothetical protein
MQMAKLNRLHLMVRHFAAFDFCSIIRMCDILYLEMSNESSSKRAASPNNESKSLEYLIRGELDRACPTMSRRDGNTSKHFIEGNII